MYSILNEFREALTDENEEAARERLSDLPILALPGAIRESARYGSKDLIQQAYQKLDESVDSLDQFGDFMQKAWGEACSAENKEALHALVECGFEPSGYREQTAKQLQGFLENDWNDLIKEAFVLDNMPAPGPGATRNALKPLLRHGNSELFEHYAREASRSESVGERDRKKYLRTFMEELIDLGAVEALRRLRDEDIPEEVWSHLFSYAIKYKHEAVVDFFVDETDLDVLDLDTTAIASSSSAALIREFVQDQPLTDLSALINILENDSVDEAIQTRALNEFEGEINNDLHLSAIIRAELPERWTEQLIEQYDGPPLRSSEIDVENPKIEQAVPLLKQGILKDPGYFISSTFNLTGASKRQAIFEQLQDRPEALAVLLNNTRNKGALDDVREYVDLDEPAPLDKEWAEDLTFGELILLRAHDRKARELIKSLLNEGVKFEGLPDEKLREHSTKPGLFELAQNNGEEEHYSSLFGTEPVGDALKGQNPSFGKALRFLEAGAKLPEDENLFRKAIKNGRDELVEAFIENDATVNADVFYAATLHADRSTFETIAREYGPSQQAALRAANMILTNDVPLERIGRIEGLGELCDLEVDWNKQPRGSGELGRRPLEVIAGFYDRTMNSNQTRDERREDLPQKVAAAHLIDLGADPGAGTDNTALRQALAVENQELFEWFLDHDKTDIDLNDQPELPILAVGLQNTEQLEMLFERGLDGPIKGDRPLIDKLAEKVPMPDWDMQEMLDLMVDNGCPIRDEAGRRALRTLFERIADEGVDEQLLDNLDDFLQAQNHQGGVTPPADEALSIIDQYDQVLDVLSDYLNKRQQKQLRTRHQKLL